MTWADVITTGRIAEKPGVIPESRVVEMWRNCLPGGRELVTEEGGPIKVIYPGRRNGDRGADFLDAVIATRYGVVQGDIEVHVKSSGWREHRHHLDPVYNQVILHVVYQHDTGKAVSLHNGRYIPTLALNKLRVATAESPDDEGFLPCRNVLGCHGGGTVGEILDTAGEERFQARADEFKRAMAETEPGQALYQGIMAALGYAKNKLPFLKLAGRIPLRRLEAAVSSKMPEVECLASRQSLLLGTAGLLPSQRRNYDRIQKYDDEYAEKLERIWSASGEKVVMSEADWHMVKVRPGNLPARRIAAMCQLLLRYREEGLLNGLTGGIYRTAVATGSSGLENLVRVDADGYWAYNLDFRLPARGIVPALLGEGRAADIAVNVLLPFAAAQSPVNSDYGPGGQALEMYRQYPRLAANTLERHMMQQLGIDRRLVNRARRQQGLIHIYRTLCVQGRCGECPLGKAKPAA